LKSEEFKSVYLTDKYNSFGSQKNTKDLSASARLSEAQKRAQTFVDRCEQVEKQNDEQEKDLLKQLQWDEMKTVFDFTRK
jgi:predicted metal-dependent hydrolase